MLCANHMEEKSGEKRKKGRKIKKKTKIRGEKKERDEEKKRKLWRNPSDTWWILAEPEGLEPEAGRSGPANTAPAPSTQHGIAAWHSPSLSAAPSANTWCFYVSKAADFKTGDKKSLLTCTACARVFPNLFICQMSLVFTEEFLLISQTRSAPQRCTCHRVNKQGGGQCSQLPPPETRGSHTCVTFPSTHWHFDVLPGWGMRCWVSSTARDVDAAPVVPPAQSPAFLLHHGWKLEYRETWSWPT